MFAYESRAEEKKNRSNSGKGNNMIILGVISGQICQMCFRAILCNFGFVYAQYPLSSHYHRLPSSFVQV